MVWNASAKSKVLTVSHDRNMQFSYNSPQIIHHGDRMLCLLCTPYFTLVISYLGAKACTQMTTSILRFWLPQKDDAIRQHLHCPITCATRGHLATQPATSTCFEQQSLDGPKDGVNGDLATALEQ